MANKNIMQERQLSIHLQKKLEMLLKKEDELLNELQAGFNAEKVRELNILYNRIACCRNRIEGKFIDARSQFEIKTNNYDYEIAHVG